LRLHLAAPSDIEEETEKSSKAKVMNIFNLIVKLRIGEALLFAPNAAIDVETNERGEDSVKRLGTGYLKIKIRARITEDGGKSVMANAPKKTTFGTTAKTATSGSLLRGVSTVPQRTSIFDNIRFSTPSAPSFTFSENTQPTTRLRPEEPALMQCSPFLVPVLQTLQLPLQLCQVSPLPHLQLN
jgi:hypothetical protein